MKIEIGKRYMTKDQGVVTVTSPARYIAGGYVCDVSRVIWTGNPLNWSEPIVNFVCEVRKGTQLEHYFGTVCPYCHASSDRGHESNGFTGDRASYLCRECREQWDAECYAQD